AGAERVLDAIADGDGGVLREGPGKGRGLPVARVGSDLLDQARLHAEAAAGELLPDAGALGIDPVVHVAGVDLAAGRQLDPAPLAGAVGPQLEADLVLGDLGRDVVGEAGVEAGVGERLRRGGVGRRRVGDGGVDWRDRRVDGRGAIAGGR